MFWYENAGDDARRAAGHRAILIRGDVFVSQQFEDLDGQGRHSLSHWGVGPQGVVKPADTTVEVPHEVCDSLRVVVPDEHAGAAWSVRTIRPLEVVNDRHGHRR